MHALRLPIRHGQTPMYRWLFKACRSKSFALSGVEWIE
jgi:hypothetical protein